MWGPSQNLGKVGSAIGSNKQSISIVSKAIESLPHTLCHKHRSWIFQPMDSVRSNLSLKYQRFTPSG